MASTRAAPRQTAPASAMVHRAARVARAIGGIPMRAAKTSRITAKAVGRGAAKGVVKDAAMVEDAAARGAAGFVALIVPLRLDASTGVSACLAATAASRASAARERPPTVRARRLRVSPGRAARDRVRATSV